MQSTLQCFVYLQFLSALYYKNIHGKKTPKNQIMSYYKINLGRVETRLVANKNKSKVSQIVKF